MDIFVADANRFLARGDKEACEGVRRAMEEDGLFILRDPRIPDTLPAAYRRMMAEGFFPLPPEVKSRYIMPKLPDGKQIYENGWRPPFTEKPRLRTEVLPLIPEDAKPHDPPAKDPKERYMWPFGPRRETSDYPMLDRLEPINPREIKEWEPLSVAWAEVMYSAMMTVMEMLAIGFDEPPELFTSLMKYGPHRLAPTGTDLEKYGVPGCVAAGFHNDLSLLTIHGRANESGLWAWTRDWRKFAVEIPDDGCLLVQAGRILEHLTGGRTLRGYHEVVFGDDVPNTGWRVSLTAFFNAETSTPVRPIGRFKNEPDADKYDMGMTSGARQLDSLLRKSV